MIEHLNEYGERWIYTESRRFKASVASANKQLVNMEATNGLIQTVLNNFGANLSTQNRLKNHIFWQKFSFRMATLQRKKKPIPIYTKADISNVQIEEPQIHP